MEAGLGTPPIWILVIDELRWTGRGQFVRASANWPTLCRIVELEGRRVLPFIDVFWYDVEVAPDADGEVIELEARIWRGEVKFDCRVVDLLDSLDPGLHVRGVAQGGCLVVQQRLHGEHHVIGTECHAV